MSEQSNADAQGKISKEGSVVIAHHQPMQCYFRPETEELVFIAPSEAGKFESHWREMQADMNAFHLAQVAYSSALEAYGKALPHRLTPLEEAELEKAIAAAEEALEQSREKVKKQVGDFSPKGMNYEEVVELLPLAMKEVEEPADEKGKKGKKSKKRKRNKKVARYAYVKRQYYTQTKDGRRVHTVSLSNKDRATGKKSIIGKDEKGRTRIDTKLLGEQLRDLEWPKIKLELKDVLKWGGFDPEMFEWDKTLADWAESWNESANFAGEVWGADVSAGAQFMRYMGNAGASIEFDPAKKSGAVKAEMKQSLNLAAGKVHAQWYRPDRLGWTLSYARDNGQVFDMGKIRAVLKTELSGFIGASLIVEGQAQVVMKGDQQLLAGQPGSKLPRFKERKTKGAVFHKEMEKQEEGLKAAAEIFGGVRIEGTLQGSLQWLKPAEPINPDSLAAGMLSSSGEYTDFCTIGWSIAGLAGLGRGNQYWCSYINGKFCFEVAASLCFGLGAKGAFIAEVSAGNIVEFGAWLVYQLYSMDYRFFDLIDVDAFNAYTKYSVLVFAVPGRTLFSTYQALASGGLTVHSYYSEFLNDLSVGLASSRARNVLATNILENPAELLRLTPEAKGVLIYLLTRHGKMDHADIDNRGSVFLLDVFKWRKKAVLQVLGSVQTRREWRQVLTRMSVDGAKLSADVDESLLEQQQEEAIVEFLQLGFNLDEDFRRIKQRLISIRERLKLEPSVGYALAMNDSLYYELNSGKNPCSSAQCDVHIV